METKNVKIKDIFQLKSEISQLLPLKLNHLFKLELVELFEACNSIIAPVEKMRVELVEQNLGEIKPGTTEAKIQKMPGFPSFEKAFTELLEEEREIKYSPIKTKYFDIEGETVLVQLYKLIEKPAAE